MILNAFAWGFCTLATANALGDGRIGLGLILFAFAVANGAIAFGKGVSR